MNINSINNKNPEYETGLSNIEEEISNYKKRQRMEQEPQERAQRNEARSEFMYFIKKQKIQNKTITECSRPIFEGCSSSSSSSSNALSISSLSPPLTEFGELIASINLPKELIPIIRSLTKPSLLPYTFDEFTKFSGIAEVTGLSPAMIAIVSEYNKSDIPKKMYKLAVQLHYGPGSNSSITIHEKILTDRLLGDLSKKSKNRIFLQYSKQSIRDTISWFHRNQQAYTLEERITLRFSTAFLIRVDEHPEECLKEFETALFLTGVAQKLSIQEKFQLVDEILCQRFAEVDKISRSDQNHRLAITMK